MENNPLVYTASFSLESLDPVSQVRIASPYVPGSDREWIEVKAKWDTGATTCSITRELYHRLGLKAEKTYPISSFGNPEGTLAPHDIVLISLVNGPHAILALASVVDTPAGGYDMLVGMNVISAGKFSLTVNGDNLDLRLEINANYPFLKKIKNSSDSYGGQ